ncbi:MAG: hypothetical protein JST59_02665 [Actinobacteria bacterium]|nr:hypothetical protein [Actinomycetota bacterium]
MENADHSASSIVTNGFWKVGSAEYSLANDSWCRQWVDVVAVSEGLPRSRAKSLSENTLSSLEASSVVGHHPFVVVAVVRQPVSLGHIKSNSNEAKRLVVANILSNSRNVPWAASELTHQFCWIKPVELPETAIHVGLDDLVDDSEFRVGCNPFLVHERGHVSVEEVSHKGLSTSNYFFFPALDGSKTVFFMQSLVLFLAADFFRSHFQVALRQTD